LVFCLRHNKDNANTSTHAARPNGVKIGLAERIPIVKCTT
jgi:hypothetical protein